MNELIFECEGCGSMTNHLEASIMDVDVLVCKYCGEEERYDVAEEVDWHINQQEAA